MANGLKDIIGQLERQRVAIEKALAALRDVEGVAVSTSAAPVAAPAAAPKAQAKRKGGMTPEGRKRLSEALRLRWAAKREAEAKGDTSIRLGPKAKKKAGRPKKAK